MSKSTKTRWDVNPDLNIGEYRLFAEKEGDGTKWLGVVDWIGWVDLHSDYMKVIIKCALTGIKTSYEFCGFDVCLAPECIPVPFHISVPLSDMEVLAWSSR